MMGSCFFCMKDHSDQSDETATSKAKQQILNGDENANKPMDFSKIDVDNPPKDNLLTNKNNKDWNEEQTEQLEHELEKEILSKQCSNAMEVNAKMMEELDDVLDDSLELSEDDQEMPEVDMDTNENKDKNRRNSNLFRYKSQKSWDKEDLEEQESAIQKQLDYLSAQQIHQSGDPSV